MWKGFNDDLRHADALAKIAKPLDARVNLIRFHDIGDTRLQPCSKAVMEQFRDRLNNLGVTATIRASRGQDIMAACGMLAGAQNANSDAKELSDISGHDSNISLPSKATLSMNCLTDSKLSK